MKLRDENVEVEVTYDGDGFPLIHIDLNGFTGDNDRPSVEVVLDGVLIHDMFDDDDKRWLDGHCVLCGEAFEPGDDIDEGNYGKCHKHCPDFIEDDGDDGDDEDEDEDDENG